MKKRPKILVSSEIVACKLTRDMWKQIVLRADNAYPVKSDSCLLVTKRHMLHHCPCCQFAHEHSCYSSNRKYPTGMNCAKCPMTDFFSKIKVKVNKRRKYTKVNRIRKYTCENADSPYKKWCNAHGRVSVTGYSERMVQIAEEALEYWTAMKDMNITW